MNTPTENRLTYGAITFFFIAMAAVIFIANGTGDDGDSISHYLYARDAFLFPKYFFNHWAKPLFVLVAAPFAQMGWIGMKLLNLTFLTLSMVLTYQLACRWRIANAWLAPMFIAAQHRVLTHTLSGLTEPMFAFALVLCVWLYERKKFFWATLLVSFLPFIRSEGLIIFCVIAIYLLIQRQWKYLPMFAIGHLVYAFAGLAVHKSPLWVFNTMSYATLDHVYGIGKWNHFIVNMPWVTGWFVYIVLIIGLFDGLRRLILLFNKKTDFHVNELWLTYGIFMAYFVAHTLFWMLGIFASEGLMRVMLCVAPMMGIICLRGANLITDRTQHFLPAFKPMYWHGLFVVLSIIFLYKNLTWRIDFNLHPSQLTQYEASKKYSQLVEKQGYSLYSESMYIDMAFGINPFDSPQYRSFHQFIKREPLPEKSLLVWEPIFAGGMYRVPIETVRDDRRLRLIDSFEHEDFIWGGRFKTYIFQTDTNYIRQHQTTEALFFDNYELKAYPNTDHTRSKQGTLVIKIDEKLPYAPGMEGTMSSYVKQPIQNFKVTFDVFVESVNDIPSVVFQVMSPANAPVDWQKYAIDNTAIREPNRWYTVSATGSIKQSDARDIMKIYVWNPSKSAAYIDNFRVDYDEVAQ